MNADMRAAGLGLDGLFDLVHSHDWLVADAARALARRFGAPWLVTVYATEYGRHEGLGRPASAVVRPRRRAADGALGRSRDHLLGLHARTRGGRVRGGAEVGDRLVAEAGDWVLRFDWADTARQTAAVYDSLRAPPVS